MSTKWKYKIELKSDRVLRDIEKEIGTDLPTELVHFIEENNAASPDKSCVKVSSIERVFEEVLSFNEKEIDAATYSAARKVIPDKYMIPFAVDPFGNLFCYSIKSKKITFYLLEEKMFVETSLSLSSLIDELY